MNIRFFEVATGKNKGFYFVENFPDFDTAAKIFGLYGFNLGLLDEGYHRSFYQRHRATGYRIWTYTSETGYEYTREVFMKHVDALESRGYVLVRE